MKIDLTCPVELWHYALPTQQYPVCRLQLFNLTEQAVTSVQAVFSCFDQEGTLISRQVERVQRLSGQPRSAFEMAVVVEDGAQAAGMDFSVEKVWFEDGTVWRHQSSSVAEYMPNALQPGLRLEVLRSLAGADAMGFPSDQGAVWVCVCGRPNAAGEDTCRRCGRNKREVFTGFNEATVETVIFEQENAREEKARRERAQAKQQAEAKEAALQRRRRRRRRILGTVFGTLAVAILAFGVFFHGIPFYRYYKASRQLENGVYAAARAEFEALAEERGKRSLPVKIDALGLDFDLFDMRLYYESAELARECTYRQANDTMNTGTIPALRTAQDTFDGLGDYKDSASLAKEARYRRAELMLASRQYESVIALYDEIGAYRDAPAKRTEALYQWAVQQMEAGQYADAREKFLALDQYQDAARRAQLCLYQPALAALEETDYARAIELLTQLDAGFEGTALKLQEAYYGLAGAYFASQQYDEAAEYYLLAGDYRDAYSQATACLYEPACQLLEQGEYAQAKEMFDKILAFRDSLEKSWQCAEGLGRIAMEAGDYETARTILGEAIDYEPAQALLMESYYIPATGLQADGDLDGALALFESIRGYLDTDERVAEIRYTQAMQKMEAEDYTGAIALLESLEEYKDSGEKLQDAQYSYALTLLDGGSYADAIARLEAMDGYATSKEDLEKAHYLLGEQLMAEGNVADAVGHFEQAGEYQDAIARYKSCIYGLAEAAMQADEYEQAAEYLEKIPDYGDAEYLRSRSVYYAAEQYQEEGRLAEAAEMFNAIAGYEDAAERAAACYDAYYAETYNTAKQAMDSGDFALAISALESVNRANASADYAGLESMYQEANYRYANQLYDEKKPYQALPYYRNIPDYKDVAKKLDRVCYRILGAWISRTGVFMQFNDDGTCSIDGKDYYFRASQFSFYVGTDPDNLNAEWTIFSCQGNSLSVQNNKSRSQYSLTRVEE